MATRRSQKDLKKDFSKNLTLVSSYFAKFYLRLFAVLAGRYTFPAIICATTVRKFLRASEAASYLAVIQSGNVVQNAVVALIPAAKRLKIL